MTSKPALRLTVVGLLALAIVAAATSRESSEVERIVEDPGAAGFVMFPEEPHSLTLADDGVGVALVAYMEEEQPAEPPSPTVVSIHGECGPECEQRIEQAAAELAPDAPVIVRQQFIAGGEDRIVVMVDDGEAVRAVDRAEVLGLVMPLDTATELWLAVGNRGWVRSSEDGWQVLTSRLTSICLPIVTEYTLSDLDPDGALEIVGTHETSRRACI